MKILFLFTFLFSLSYLSYGQTIYHVSKLIEGVYDESAKKWSWNDEKSTDMTITLNGNVYSFSNRVNSEITTRDIFSENNNGKEKKTIWNASDQNGKECNIILATTITSGKQSITLFYLNVGVVVYKLD